MFPFTNLDRSRSRAPRADRPASPPPPNAPRIEPESKSESESESEPEASATSGVPTRADSRIELEHELESGSESNLHRDLDLDRDDEDEDEHDPEREEGSVTRLIRGLREGEPEAIDALWGRYFARLVALARRRLQSRPHLADHDEDAALSAFQSFFRRSREGHFADLCDREDLWIQLATLTHQKVVDLQRREMAQKRGGGRVVRESEMTDDTRVPLGFADQVGGEPDPEFVAIMSEECRLFLDRLRDETLREIALLRMSLYTNREIADRFGRSLSWVNRKIERIKVCWEPSRS